VVCKTGDFYLEDGCAATENILLAAHAHGLGACWVGGDKMSYAPGVCQMVGVPEGYKLVSLIAIGYADERPQVEKRPLESVLHWDTFGQAPAR
jgi:nitroreductase